LLERACVRIRAAVQADGGSFQLTQIKEKYATLRAYWHGALSPEADARVEEAVDLAEARSAVSCEICGEPGLAARPRLVHYALRGARRGPEADRGAARRRYPGHRARMSIRSAIPVNSSDRRSKTKAII
jgi:hypothetical protein